MPRRDEHYKHMKMFILHTAALIFTAAAQFPPHVQPIGPARFMDA